MESYHETTYDLTPADDPSPGRAAREDGPRRMVLATHRCGAVTPKAGVYCTGCGQPLHRKDGRLI